MNREALRFRQALAVVGALALLALSSCGSDDRPLVRVGSKDFNEGAILGDLAVQLIEESGARIEYRDRLVTNVLWQALLEDKIDVYPEYTGTLMREVLRGEEIQSVEQLREALEQRGLRMSEPLGFSNSYALGMKRKLANRLGIKTISDLARQKHSELRLGFSNEFVERGDGWNNLRDAYGLPQTATGLAHSLAYESLDNGQIDVTDLYTTDAEIEEYDLVALEDDRNHFPRYDAVWLYRADLERRNPKAVAALRRLEGRFDESKMIAMNSRSKLGKVPSAQVAADFLTEELGFPVKTLGDTMLERLLARTLEHLVLVGISLGAAILVAIPLGVFSAGSPRFGRFVLGAVGVIQTIPSLALLVLFIPLLGIGGPPAIAALFLYSLLPIVQNTFAGLRGIPPNLMESAEALGLPPRTRLLQIELPMASRSILAGIKTSAVINVGTATLGGFIGAGGFGQPIFTGIRQNDHLLLLEGAVPAALLALLLQGAFELIERRAVPLGLRLSE